MNLPNFDLSKLSVGSVKNAFDEVIQDRDYNWKIQYSYYYAQFLTIIYSRWEPNSIRRMKQKERRVTL